MLQSLQFAILEVSKESIEDGGGGGGGDGGDGGDGGGDYNMLDQLAEAKNQMTVAEKRRIALAALTGTVLVSVLALALITVKLTTCSLA